MTTIIMHETEEKVLIAFDSKASGGGSTNSTSAQKVFVNTSADVIIGVAGLARAAYALRYADLPVID